MKNAIVLNDKEGKITVIAFEPYNKAIIYNSVQPMRQANEIIEKLDNGDYEIFDESKMKDYEKSSHLIIIEN
jgi:hypothetical protein